MRIANQTKGFWIFFSGFLYDELDFIIPRYQRMINWLMLSDNTVLHRCFGACHKPDFALIKAIQPFEVNICPVITMNDCVNGTCRAAYKKDLRRFDKAGFSWHQTTRFA
jgi:hypothetical protein